MARLITDGAEFQNFAYIDAYGGQGNTPSIRTDGYSKDGRSYECNQWEWIRYDISSTSGSEFYITFAHSCYAPNLNNYPGLCLRMRDSANNEPVQLRKDSRLQYRLMVMGTEVAVVADLLHTYQWMSFHVKPGANGTVEWRVDGKPIYSNTNINVGLNPIEKFLFLNSINYQYQWIDDVKINDTNGSDDNSWPRNSAVVILQPDGDGDQTDLIPSTGNNWQCVDELPPNSSDYTSGSNAGDYDLYELEDYTHGGRIDGVIPMVYGKANVANDGIKMGVKTSGSEAWDSSTTQLTTSDRLWQGEKHYTEPDDSPITPALLDSMQVGVKIA